MITCFFSPPADVASLALGGPGPLCPAADLHEQICQLVWQHAPRPLPDEAGSHFVQGPGVYTAQKIQRHRETLTDVPESPFPKGTVEPRVTRCRARTSRRAGGSLSRGASWSRRIGRVEEGGEGLVLNEVLLSKNVQRIIVLV